MIQLHTTVKSGKFSTEIVVGGWARAVIYGPLHKRRAKKIVAECQLKTAIMLIREKRSRYERIISRSH